jgi:hypothetical protein
VQARTTALGARDAWISHRADQYRLLVGLSALFFSYFLLLSQRCT